MGAGNEHENGPTGERLASSKDAQIHRLAALLIADDEAELARLTGRGIGEDDPLDLRRLQRARAVLAAVGHALDSDDPAGWELVEQLWRTLPPEARTAPSRAAAPRAAQPVMAIPPPSSGADGDSVASSESSGEPMTPGAPARDGGDRVAAAASSAGTPSLDRPDARREPPAFRGSKSSVVELAPHSATQISPLPVVPGAAPPAGAHPTRHRGEAESWNERTTLAHYQLPEVVARPAEEPLGQPSPPVALTVEQYASFCAECAVAPAQLVEARLRYQLADEHAHRTLDHSWQRRFDLEPRLRDRWQELFQHYCEWLERQPR